MKLFIPGARNAPRKITMKEMEIEGEANDNGTNTPINKNKTKV